LAALVTQTEGWTGAKLALLVQRAALLCICKTLQDESVVQTQNNMHNLHSVSEIHPLSSGSLTLQLNQEHLQQAREQLA
jgi:hypothetical protein